MEQLGIFSSREQTPRAMSAYCTAASQAALKNDAAMRDTTANPCSRASADAQRLCVERSAAHFQVSFYWPLRDGK
ncbi:MAG: hypothetical protein E5Y58_20290 [Mesorhizobium sp.]|nr:MAG: hypothetical protein E5Y58_20290 [Mesorhizobium sp.]